MKAILSANWGHIYWPVYILTASLAFAIPELVGLITGHQNTLSEYSWGQLDVHTGQLLPLHGAAWWCSLIAFLVFVAVIVSHIWFHGV